jgi:8-oxo-dGTP diphosphatase
MKKFTLGFVFTPGFEKVLLVHKEKPEWQKGLMNGVGGKYEPGESAEECVSREVLEESGLEIAAELWRYVGKMKTETWCVDVLTAVWDGDPAEARKCDYEEVEWVSVKCLSEKTLSNIPWLVAMCQDALENDLFEDFTVKYR